MIFPYFPLLYLCYHYHPSWVVLTAKWGQKCCCTALLFIRWQEKNQQGREYFYCVFFIATQLRHISHLLYNLTPSHWLLNVYFYMSNSHLSPCYKSSYNLRRKGKKKNLVASNAWLSVAGGAFGNLRHSVPKGNYLACQCKQEKAHFHH